MDFYDRLQVATARHGNLAARGRWDLTRHEHRVISQNGEDGVIGALLGMVGTTNCEFVEFGASDGRENSCGFLAQVLGWSGLFVEPEDTAHARLADLYGDRPDVRIAHDRVRPDTMEAIFDATGVPASPDVLCIDVDGNDAYLLQALRRTPRVLVVEYNGSLPRDREVQLVQPYSDVPWDGTAFFGASLGALEEIAATKGYALVHTDLAGVNAFFARADVAAVLPPGLQAPRRPANYGLGGGGHRPDPQGRAFLELPRVDGTSPA